ncbi:MAG: hypothetical protein PHV17_02115 [Candidatus Omnitrophica bacterium]|nr:hypothetical protein [Candidatus Omnitrophota bacterium]
MFQKTLKIFSQRTITDGKGFLLFSLLIGFFLHFRNLKDAVCLYPDEVRAFTLMPSGPMIYLLSHPLFKIFSRINAPYYLIAVLSVLSIGLLYWLVKNVFNASIAGYTVLIYTLLPFRIHYSRILYPAVFVDFFLLLLLLSLYYSLIRTKPYLILLSGLLSSCLIFIHPMTYAELCALLITIITTTIAEKEKANYNRLFKLSLIYIAALILSFLLLEKLFILIKSDYIYSKQLLGFHHEVKSGIIRDGNRVVELIKTILTITTHSLGSFYRTLTILFSIVIGLIFAFKDKDRKFIYTSVFFISGLTVFITMASLKLHETHLRHFVWLSPFFSLSLAYVLLKTKTDKKIIYSLLFIFLVSSAVKSFKLTEETFTTNGIKTWLKQNNIEKKEIITFLMLQSPKDKTSAAQIPCRNREHWYSIYPKKQEILWPYVYAAYKQNLIKYIIPSGPGTLAYLGEDDPMLDDLTPVKKWLHPNWKFKNRFANQDFENPVFIKVYSLNDVFSPKNLDYAQKANTFFFNGLNWKRINFYALSKNDRNTIKSLIVKTVISTSIFSNNPILNSYDSLKDTPRIIFKLNEFYNDKEKEKIPISIAIRLTADNEIEPVKGLSYKRQGSLFADGYDWHYLESLRLPELHVEKLKNTVIRLIDETSRLSKAGFIDSRNQANNYISILNGFYEKEKDKDIPVFFVLKAFFSQDELTEDKLASFKRIIREKLAKYFMVDNEEKKDFSF